MAKYTDADIERNKMINEINREFKQQQEEEQQKQQAAEARATAKASRRAKYKQTPEDSLPTFIWKELMR